eukprot:2373510-Pyramimonas_sp.AAC.1
MVWTHVGNIPGLVIQWCESDRVLRRAVADCCVVARSESSCCGLPLPHKRPSPLPEKIPIKHHGTTADSLVAKLLARLVDWQEKAGWKGIRIFLGSGQDYCRRIPCPSSVGGLQVSHRI